MDAPVDNEAKFRWQKFTQAAKVDRTFSISVWLMRRRARDSTWAENDVFASKRSNGSRGSGPDGSR